MQRLLPGDQPDASLVDGASVSWYGHLMTDNQLTEAQKLELKQAEFRAQQKARDEELAKIHAETCDKPGHH